MDVGTQGPVTQLTGETVQFCVLHACCKYKGDGHGLPVGDAAAKTSRVWLCQPPPHMTLHCDQPDQGDTSQSEAAPPGGGHLSVLQSRCCNMSAGQ